MKKYVVKVSCGSKSFVYETDSPFSMLCYLADRIDRRFIKHFLVDNDSNE